MDNATLLDYEHFDSKISTRWGYRIYGISLFIIITICTFAYIFVCWIFLTKPEFKKHVAYRLIVHLGIADGFNMIDSLIFRWAEIFPYKFNPGHMFGHFYSAFDIASLIPSNFMTLALAIHRLQTLKNFRFLSCVSEANFGHILAFCAYLAWLGVYIALVLTPDPPNQYTGVDNLLLDLTGRLGNSQGKEVRIIDSVVFYLQLGMVALACILYAWCTLTIILKRQVGGGPIFSKQERRILIQTMVPCIIKLISQSQWFYVVTYNMYSEMVQNFLLTIDSFYSPFFYFAANKTLRRYIFSAFGFRTKKSTTNLTASVRAITISNNVINNRIK